MTRTPGERATGAGRDLAAHQVRAGPDLFRKRRREEHNSIKRPAAAALKRRISWKNVDNPLKRIEKEGLPGDDLSKRYGVSVTSRLL